METEQKQTEKNFFDTAMQSYALHFAINLILSIAFLLLVIKWNFYFWPMEPIQKYVIISDIFLVLVWPIAGSLGFFLQNGYFDQGWEEDHEMRKLKIFGISYFLIEIIVLILGLISAKFMPE